MPVAAVTRLRLRSLRFLPPFLADTLQIAREARRAPGCLGVALRRKGAWWTLTLWSDSAAMRAFMQSGVHRRAMPHLPAWCDEASLADWEQTETTLPSWTEAEDTLARKGRVSFVKHPSPTQATGNPLGS